MNAIGLHNVDVIMAVTLLLKAFAAVVEQHIAGGRSPAAPAGDEGRPLSRRLPASAKTLSGVARRRGNLRIVWFVVRD